MSDPTVLDTARAGEPGAWRDLYRDHAARLLLWLEARADIDLDRRDTIAAATWLTAAERIHEFRGDLDDFAVLLLQVARESVPDRRSAHPPTIGPHAARPGSAFAPCDQWVRAALATLPAREREVVACRDVLALDAARAARVLGMSRLAVRAARRRGLKRLRPLLARSRSRAEAPSLRVLPHLVAAGVGR